MTSKTTVLAVVVSVAIFAILGLAGAVFLIDQGTDAALVALVTTPMGVALGALASMLASTRSTVTNGEKAPPNDLTQFVPPPPPRPPVQQQPRPVDPLVAARSASDLDRMQRESAAASAGGGSGQHP